MGAEVSLSLCMILKDEAYFLARCLDAVRDFVDEIVLVDTGSTDDTVEIGRGYTDRIFHFDWIDDFAAARNYALAQASGDWILVLDADELMTAEDLAVLRAALAGADEEAFSLDQLNYLDDPTERDWQPLDGPQVFGWDYPGFRRNPSVRLFRNRPDIRFSGKVHEIVDDVALGLRCRDLGLAIHHDMSGNPARDVRQRQLGYLRMMEKALAERPDGRLAARAAGVRMYMLQDYSGAVALLQQAVEQGFEAERNREAIAECYYRQGDLVSATEAYRALYSDGFASASLCNNFSNLLVKAGEYATAIEVLERALVTGQPAPERQARLRHNIDYLRRQLAANG